jgi:hypothetical protein
LLVNIDNKEFNCKFFAVKLSFKTKSAVTIQPDFPKIWKQLITLDLGAGAPWQKFARHGQIFAPAISAYTRTLNPCG